MNLPCGKALDLTSLHSLDATYYKAGSPVATSISIKNSLGAPIGNRHCNVLHNN